MLSPQTKTSVAVTEAKVLMVAHVQSDWDHLLSELSRWKGISGNGAELSCSATSH